MFFQFVIIPPPAANNFLNTKIKLMYLSFYLKLPLINDLS